MGFSPSLSCVLPRPRRRPGPRGPDLRVRPLFSAHVRCVEDDAGDVDEAGVVESMQHSQETARSMPQRR